MTSRSAVECSTTELYPQLWKWIIIVLYNPTVVYNDMINHSCNMIPKIEIQRIWWMSCLLFCYWYDILECFIILIWHWINWLLYLHRSTKYFCSTMSRLSISLQVSTCLSLYITWPILSTTLRLNFSRISCCRHTRHVHIL